MIGSIYGDELILSRKKEVSKRIKEKGRRKEVIGEMEKKN
jgi:hypothetical protein